MSLDWNIEGIENHQELLVPAPADQGEGFVLDGVTNGLIWISMATGLGKNWSLDADFAPEFYARVRLLDQLGGPLLTQSGKPYKITPEDVQRRIGLKVNVSPKTRAAFLKTIGTDLDNYKREYERAIKAAAAA
jgi:hypothetical protein